MTGMKNLRGWLTGPTALAALAGVVAAAVVLAVAELLGAFFTARATPLFALGSTFIDFTPSWLKDFAIATFGTNDKAALFVGMGLTIAVLACVLGIVAYRKWALGVLGVLFMGAVIVASVVTRAGVGPADAIPSVLGTLAGLVALRLLVAPLWGLKAWPEAPADMAADMPPADSSAPADQAGTSRRRFFAAAGLTAAAAGLAATGGRLLGAARSNIAQARDALQLPAPVKAAARLARWTGRRPHRIPRHAHLRFQSRGRQPCRQRQVAGPSYPRGTEAGQAQGRRGHGPVHVH